jgi:hypothetical protein
VGRPPALTTAPTVLTRPAVLLHGAFRGARSIVAALETAEDGFWHKHGSMLTAVAYYKPQPAHVIADGLAAAWR